MIAKSRPMPTNQHATNTTTAPIYRGRFAPSPTGPLHFGSLIAAVASYLQAKACGGEWLVRIEDIDPHREIPGASAAILDSLRIHGFEFPDPLYQSSRLDLYRQITAELLKSDLAYPCSCTRQQLRQSASSGRAGYIYPGTCRSGNASDAVSVRIRTTDTPVEFIDALQGRQSCHLESEVGDFLIRRGDGFVAYQLAVVIDDHDQQITEVVRGTDLLYSTFMQISLQQALQYSTPGYMHFPIAVRPDGEKLSKQTGALALSSKNPVNNLFQTLVFLKQNPDESLQHASLKDIWEWASQHWNPNPLISLRNLPDKSMILQ
jgi:glutamyl-Q tRNA(Asp) synthetase